MPPKPKTDPLITDHDKAILEKLRKMRLRPSISLYACAAGATFAYVQVSWTTVLIEGTLQVLVDQSTDITAELKVDEAAMKAIGVVDLKGVGLHALDARGEFLARLLPLATIQLSASGGVYLPY